jgi:hypothetical protein
VVDFGIPYCREVEAEAITTIDDGVLNNIWDAVNKLSKQLSPWHRIFQQKYFGDLSFLFSALAFGFNEALQLKYTVVRNYLIFKNEDTFKKVIENINYFKI